MSDQGSTYAIIQSVPVMVSPLYNLPGKIMIASELKIVPEDVTKLPAYPFSVEREVIAQVETARKRMYDEEELFNLKKRQYEEERAQQQKAAARKIAPGFLDTDTRILQPQPTFSTEFPKENNNETVSPKTHHAYVSSPQEINIGFNPDKINVQQFDYYKFEQGLAPADPWDTPENDMSILKSILGQSNSPHTPSLYPPSPQIQQQPQISRPYQKNEGVYWSFQTSNSNMSGHGSPQLLGRQLPFHSVPALPPKLFNSPPLPSSSTSSPIMAPPTLPPPSQYHKQQQSSISANPPPIPPLPMPQPSFPSESLISELSNMGFTRAQASEALQRNDHDLIKATHFLLDQA